MLCGDVPCADRFKDHAGAHAKKHPGAHVTHIATEHIIDPALADCRSDGDGRNDGLWCCDRTFDRNSGCQRSLSQRSSNQSSEKKAGCQGQRLLFGWARGYLETH